MPKVTYIAFDGEETIVDAKEGMSVMQSAVNNGVDGIVAECGGACSCATCHVYVDEAWFEKLPEAQAMEKEMLDFVMSPQPTSRLSCQIKVTAELDGLVVNTLNRSIDVYQEFSTVTLLGQTPASHCRTLER